jgi:hypothetical protein
VSKEGSQKSFAVLDSSGVAAGGRGDLVEGEEGDVGEGVVLEERPEVFDGVELGGVGREQLHVPCRSLVEPRLHLLRPVDLEAIPDQNARSRQMTPEQTEELEDLAGSDVAARVKPKVQANPIALWCDGECRQSGDFLMGPGPLQEDRRVAAGRPRATHDRGHQEAAFVEEDEVGPEAPGFFLMRGQSCLTQR